jgi:hypothetical protein
MLRGIRISVVAGLFGAGALGIVAGCWPFTEGADCDTAFINCPTTTSSSSGTGGDGGMHTCDGDPTQDASLVREECGVFVQADAAGSNEDGTRANPYRTLQKAIDNAGGKHVYACTSAPFAEAVTISTGIDVYGGFDCAKGWSWSQDARAQLNGPADTIALTITAGAEGAKVAGFAITAASPSDMTMGGSSIAVAVDDVAATLDHCNVRASDAADGVKGTTPSDPVTPGQDAPAPVHGQMDACVNPGSLMGGPPGVTMCGAIDTSGGPGGKGGITGTMSGNGLNGATGANPAASPLPGMDGIGGAGQMDPAGVCQPGDPGAPGDKGGPGTGGSVSGDTLALSGITSGDDTDGKPGMPGQGGGGGGGAKSGMFCLGSADGNGASGGGGGAGGCGGKGGGGGKAGGSSVAIVSLGTKLTLTEVTLTSGKGGKGGDGAAAQTGGSGGSGAKGGTNSGTAPSIDGCDGGKGGKGGVGGPGAGGRGGHSIGIAYAKAPAMLPVVKTFMQGTPGSAGSGAAGAPDGAPGRGCKTLDFTNPASPTACAM